VVGRLVEQQGVGTGEQDAGELDPAALTTRQGADRLAQDAVVQAEVAGDPLRLGLRRPAAEGVELGVGARPAGHRLLPDGVVSLGHVPLGLAEPGATTSMPRAARMRARASCSRSPVRGSCGR
jgi:hypothetical protein